MVMAEKYIAVAYMWVEQHPDKFDFHDEEFLEL